MPTRTLAWTAFLVLSLALALRLKPAQNGAVDDLQREQAAYHFIRDQIRDRYVREVDDRRLFYGAMDGMAQSLDPFSRFLAPEQYEMLRTATTGLLEGIGIEWDPEAEGFVVLTPLQDSPAWKGGVFPGDSIQRINGVETAGLSFEDVGKRIRGLAGTKIKLTIDRKGVEAPVDLELERAVFEIPSIPVAEFLPPATSPTTTGPRIGYVQIAQFQEHTASDLEKALNDMEGAGMKGLVLDLRQNPGGLLDAAERVADLFLKDGEIVTVINREARNSGSPGNVAYASEPGTHPDYPIAVLIDGQSASAAEIVSGALKDRGRAVLVGDRSYGKFSVQDIIRVPLGNWGESALKLTIARYKTPLSPCIDGQGLEPDLPVHFTNEQLRGLLIARRQRHVLDNDPRNSVSQERSRNGNGGPAPSHRDTAAAAPIEFNDLQLRKAVEWISQRLAQPH
jgi:carboxyl-terminal processing protease